MSQETLETNVLIAGAGPVGKTIASELRRHGVDCKIVDRATGPKDISKAMILHARTQEVQELMGVLEDSKAQSVPMTQLQMHAYGKLIATVHAQVESPHPHPLILGQDRTERILERHLERLGGKVDWETELISFEQDAEGVTSTIRLKDGTEQKIRSKYLVGSEGSNSVVRKSLGLTFEGGRYEGEQFIQADCKIKWDLPSGMSYLYLTADGYLMVIEMPDGVVRIFISLPDDPNAVKKALEGEAGAVEDKSAAPTLEEIRTNLERLTGLKVELSDPTWLARYRTSHRYTNRFSVGRAFVAGDAAHVHVPLGGQGMNTGIQDGFNLGWKLAYVLKGWAPDSLLSSYHEERHPVAKSLIEGTDKGYTNILHPSELAQKLVTNIGPFLLSKPVLQSKLMNVLEEIKIAYLRSPLTEDHGGSDGPVAGERAPDAVVVRFADRKTVRLHQAIQGGKWTLFGFEGDGDQGAIAGAVRDVSARFSRQVQGAIVVPRISAVGDGDLTLLDAEGFAHRAYGVGRGRLYLIRPDGYIGFRGGAASLDKLGEYLGKVLNA